MNDPLKKFVDKHREEFDDLEPSAEIWKKISGQIKPNASDEKIKRLYVLTRWAIVASVLLVFGIGLFLLQNKEIPTEQVAKTKHSTPKEEPVSFTEEPGSLQKKEETKSKVQPTLVLAPKRKEPLSIEVKGDIYQTEKDAVLQLLADEESPSARISGLIKTNKLNHIDDELMNVVVEYAINDENSNVRLAAVDVLVAHITESRASDLLIKAFVKQDDPIVQTELIDIISNLGNMSERIEVEQKLVALTEDPMAESFVKDMAYAVLLK
ncbi:HEAT repeat domain-containing protein [Sphingobacterium wenxiniae]|uniref:HEAT repeat-containing protein n=1 Tax=Sphingobacterium wenxiniae TaxID=683125 RepID=A0A1I6VA16_9SPHI|nr:HEAT repeat domain-containing protein [Sphingobacterium wenxiniae]SFT10559.1 hypothetical protein SAMN05660206_11234 [Sphingobacterium wenxiniae]